MKVTDLKLIDSCICKRSGGIVMAVSEKNDELTTPDFSYDPELLARREHERFLLKSYLEWKSQNSNRPKYDLIQIIITSTNAIKKKLVWPKSLQKLSIYEQCLCLDNFPIVQLEIIVKIIRSNYEQLLTFDEVLEVMELPTNFLNLAETQKFLILEHFINLFVTERVTISIAYNYLDFLVNKYKKAGSLNNTWNYIKEFKDLNSK
ncbi:MAG: hypothetical protein WA839_12570 [Flavobacteriaceae bacterium]